MNGWRHGDLRKLYSTSHLGSKVRLTCGDSCYAGFAPGARPAYMKRIISGYYAGRTAKVLERVRDVLDRMTGSQH